MTVIGYPLDAVASAPSYTGRKLRQTIAALIAGATSARPLGAFSGVRPGTSITTVTNSGFTWSCATHAGALDLESAAEAGPYLYAVTATETGAITAANGSNARTDLLCAHVDDPAESDGSSVPAITIIYTAGTAGPGAPVPSTPARSMVLARINVPVSGGGNPTITWVAPVLSAAGAPFRVPLYSDLAALPAYTDAEAIVASTPGATWRYVGGWKMFGTPRFADSTARDAAITSPVLGMKCVLTSDEVTYRYGSAWKEWESDWTAYVPTLTNITLGSGGTVTGTRKFTGGEVFGKVVITLGTGFAFSSAAKFSTGVTIAAAVTTEVVVGELTVRDVSASSSTIAKLEQLAADTTVLTLAYFGASNALSQMTNAAPIALAAGDIIVANFRARV